jgi:3-deoxy-D-manno-octulosonic-acid transferase
MFLLYSILFSAAFLLAAPGYWWRYRRRANWRAYWRERLGYLGIQPPSSAQPAIWVHAVSVGETLGVVRLVQEIRRRHPDRPVFMSHVTPTGREAGAARLPDLAGRFYLPFDWQWSVKRVLRQVRPGLLLIAETELWPNLLQAAHQFGARVVIVNARLSDRSFRGYRLVRPFMRRVLANVDLILAQTERDAERFRALAAPAERVRAVGNLKFDATPVHVSAIAPCLEQALRSTGRQPVLIAASTMPKEEPLVLKAWGQVRRRFPRGLLILAPRHPERFDAVAAVVAEQGYRWVRRTGLAGDRIAGPLAQAEVLLLDTIGELGGLLRCGDVVFVGGSLVPAGGHNLLEPAYWGKPILFGPHMENFRDAAMLFLQEDAALEVQDADGLARAAQDLLADAERQRRMGAAARRLLERESGATGRVLEALAALGF